MEQIIKSNTQVDRIARGLLVLVLFGALLLPPLLIMPGLPKFELAILIFPFLFLITVLFKRKEILEIIKFIKIPISIMGIFVLIIILSILTNGRWNITRDWFEVIKFILFGAYICFFTLYFNSENLKKILAILFSGVVLFNLLHYFNVFNFNEIIEPFYSQKHHLDRFGLNSIGQPSTKRALGTLGNPNNNAVLFLIFTLIFLPVSHRFSRYIKLIIPSVAIIGLFMCQSRTGMIAYIIVLIIYLISIRTSLRFGLYFLLLSCGIYLTLDYFGNSYLSSVTDSTAMVSAEKGRTVQWKGIIDQMPGNWLLGNAPNKTFFEENKIHSESEYFLILFRYGILGIIAYLAFWSSIFIRSIKKGVIRYSLSVYLVVAYALLAFTNNPIHAPKLMLMFTCAIAISFIHEKEVQIEKT